MNQRIKQVRKKQNLTQNDFAKTIGISQSSLSEIEKGTIPSADIIIRICKTFNISADWLLLGINNDFLTDEEKKIIEGYRQCTEKEKGRIEEIIDSSENKKIYIKTGNL